MLNDFWIIYSLLDYYRYILLPTYRSVAFCLLCGNPLIAIDSTRLKYTKYSWCYITCTRYVITYDSYSYYRYCMIILCFFFMFPKTSMYFVSHTKTNFLANGKRHKTGCIVMWLCIVVLIQGLSLSTAEDTISHGQ